MKNLLLVVVFVASAICASAQKVYFMYLQSENSSPFYVKMNDKIHSSATSGYLILSNLVDSSYNFSIGFPALQSEARFTVKLGAKDRGFLIKNFESGTGLFDLQNLTIINQHKDDSPKNISYLRRNDDFSFLLSKAANDTSLLYTVVRTQEEVVTAPEPQLQSEEQRKTEVAIVSGDTAVVSSTQTVISSEVKNQDSVAIAQPTSQTKTEVDITNTSANDGLQKDSMVAFASKTSSKPDSVNNLTNPELDSLANHTSLQTSNGEKVFKRSHVKKYSESSTSEGFGLVYFDISDEVQDTIRLLIPNPPIELKASSETDSVEMQKNTVHLEEIKSDTVLQTPIVVAAKISSPVKSQCKANASDNDFFRLRKNMAAENTDEAMISEAKKIFKSKCFTTEQIKNLGALFLTSAGKYQFFDASYLHVADQENFASLESEIRDDYYIKRFKALIGE